MTGFRPDDIATRREELAALTLELLSFDTSNPPGDTRGILESIEAWLAERAIETEQFAVDPAKPNLLGTIPGERDDRTFLFNGHLDTVRYEGEEWAHDPLGDRVGDRIYGRGATDMKGAIAAMLMALGAHAGPDTTPPVTLRFAFVSDEEVAGDAGLPALLEAGRVNADACLIGEPTCEDGRHSVTVADRGSIWLTIEATGEAAHGSRPVLGENAIDRLYDAIETLRERFGRTELDIDPTLEPIIEESVDYYAASMGQGIARDLFRYPSINLGTLEGGRSINVVPDSARAGVDIRLAAGTQTEPVLSAIRDCVADCEGVTIADVSWSVGTAEPIESPLVEAVVATAEDVGGERVYRRSATGGGDAKRLRNRGIPTVEFAFATDTAHAVDEYTTIDAIVANAAVYASLPQAWAAASPDV